MSNDIVGLSNTPDVYPQKLDLIRDAVFLMAMTEAGYRGASFLDDRILLQNRRAHWASYAAVAIAMSGPPNVRPLHFIFHSGHVGSTLLSRLLDETGVILSLREPLPLRTLADAHDALNSGSSLLDVQQFEARLETVLALWSRGYTATKAVVVKATSVASRFAPTLLSARPDARAVYLNVSSESYLATLLAGENSAIDLKGHSPQRSRRLSEFLGQGAHSLSAMSIGELAAMSWLVETLTQRAVMSRFGNRVLGIDFDEMLRTPAETLSAVMRHIGIEIQQGSALDISRGQAMTRYSKAPEFSYSPQLRFELLAEARVVHAHELQKGRRFLELLGAQYPMVAAVL